MSLAITELVWSKVDEAIARWSLPCAPVLGMKSVHGCVHAMCVVRACMLVSVKQRELREGEGENVRAVSGCSGFHHFSNFVFTGSSMHRDLQVVCVQQLAASMWGHCYLHPETRQRG